MRKGKDKGTFSQDVQKRRASASPLSLAIPMPPSISAAHLPSASRSFRCGLRDFPPRESHRNGNLSKICLSRTLWFPLLSGTSESLAWHLYSLHLWGYDLPQKQAWMSDTRRPLSILRRSCQASLTHSHLGGFSHLSGRERACLLGSGHG